MTVVRHLERPAERLVTATDMLAELLRSPDNLERARYLAESLKGDAEFFRDLVQTVVRAEKA